MQTTHRIIAGDSSSMEGIAQGSIQLVVTSPPYPMIQMWDELFCRDSRETALALADQNANQAFEAMHRQLDRIWGEVARVLSPGGIVCINIGDAVRTLGGTFQLFCNHARVLGFFLAHGFQSLPAILWRKQTNAPNKFMGSGMLPPGAYATLEHEYILILRNGPKREFVGDGERKTRAESAFFWEERNVWFSDVWDFKGTRQTLPGGEGRTRSAAYPFALASRLINMFSVQGDTVLDPFLGTGTTTRAAMASARNSIGFELDNSLTDGCDFETEMIQLNACVCDRLQRHSEFISTCKAQPKYRNQPHGFPVKTRQETQMKLWGIRHIERLEGGLFRVEHELLPGE